MSANSCLLMYYEGPLREVHKESIPTWGNNKNIDFFIISNKKITLEKFKVVSAQFDNIHYVKFDLFEEIINRGFFTDLSLKYLLSKRDTVTNRKLVICGLKMFLLTEIFSFITRKYKIRGWIDHDVFLSSDFNPIEEYECLYKKNNGIVDKIELNFRHDIGQLFLINYVLDFSFVRLLNDYSVKMRGKIYRFDELGFQNSLRNRVIKKGLGVFLKKKGEIKSIENRGGVFYLGNQKLVFYSPKSYKDEIIV